VRPEQVVDELAKVKVVQGEDGQSRTVRKEARLDLLVREGQRLWWVDFTAFHPFRGTKSTRPRDKWEVGDRVPYWSVRDREKGKHEAYPTRQDGRRTVADGQLVPLAVNSYGAIGPEGQAWLGAISRVAARKGRDSARDSLPAFVQSLVVFFTAGNVLVAHGAAGRLAGAG